MFGLIESKRVKFFKGIVKASNGILFFFVVMGVSSYMFDQGFYYLGASLIGLLALKYACQLMAWFLIILDGKKVVDNVKSGDISGLFESLGMDNEQDSNNK